MQIKRRRAVSRTGDGFGPAGGALLRGYGLDSHRSKEIGRLRRSKKESA